MDICGILTFHLLMPTLLMPDVSFSRQLPNLVPQMEKLVFLLSSWDRERKKSRARISKTTDLANWRFSRRLLQDALGVLYRKEG